MNTQTTTRSRIRIPLTRERVLEAAMRLADQGGIEGLSMRKLGQALGVEAMALYYHFELPAIGADWKAAMRRRAISVRDALLRHRWAIGLMESRTNPGPANLRHHDAVIGSLRAGGFDMAAAATAYSLLDAYIYGFALTKMNLPFETTTDIAEMAETMLEPFPSGEYPNLAAFITEHAMKPGYDFADEFEVGLDVILDGLERVRDPA